MKAIGLGFGYMIISTRLTCTVSSFHFEARHTITAITSIVIVTIAVGNVNARIVPRQTFVQIY